MRSEVDVVLTMMTSARAIYTATNTTKTTVTTTATTSNTSTTIWYPES